MFQQRDEAKKILTKYAKIDDPLCSKQLEVCPRLHGKIPLVKREGVQVVLEQRPRKIRKPRVHRRAILR